MCGIVGYIGAKDSVPIIMDSLRRLEYRGYDSAGIAVIDASGALAGSKAEGKLARLAERLAVGQALREPGEFPLGLRARQRAAGVDDRDAGRIVSAILEPAQGVHDDRNRVLGADVSDDAAHSSGPI